MGRRGAQNLQRSIYGALSRHLELFLIVSLIGGKALVSVSNQGQRSESSLLVPEHKRQRGVIVAAVNLDAAAALRHQLLLGLVESDPAHLICGGFRGEVRGCAGEPGLCRVCSYSKTSPEEAGQAKTSSQPLQAKVAEREPPLDKAPPPPMETSRWRLEHVPRFHRLAESF